MTTTTAKGFAQKICAAWQSSLHIRFPVDDSRRNLTFAASQADATIGRRAAMRETYSRKHQTEVLNAARFATIWCGGDRHAPEVTPC